MGTTYAPFYFLNCKNVHISYSVHFTGLYYSIFNLKHYMLIICIHFQYEYKDILVLLQSVTHLQVPTRLKKKLKRLEKYTNGVQQRIYEG